MHTIIDAFLAQSPKTNRYYFTAQSFQGHTLKDNNGDAFEYLSPKGNNDLRNLPADAIKTAILPIEWNDDTRATVVKRVGATAKINTETGELILEAPAKSA